MPNVLKITVEAADEILNAGAYGAGALIRLQTAATQAGAFADVSGTGSTPTLPIVAGTRSYTGYDPIGVTSSWYRTRYENAGGTRLSDWTTPFQAGGADAGLICSLYNIRQRLKKSDIDTDDDELLLDFIEQIGSSIMGYCARQFVRSPQSGTSTFLLEVLADGRTLWMPQGIAELTQLEVATSSQPASGGTYSIVPAAEWVLRPLPFQRAYGWPATRIDISDLSGYRFYAGYNTIRGTGATGFPAVPGEIARIAENAVIKAWQSKGQGYTMAATDLGGRLLRGMGPDEMATLDRYRVPSIS